jgi:hypothetical protein
VKSHGDYNVSVTVLAVGRIGNPPKPRTIMSLS